MNDDILKDLCFDYIEADDIKTMLKDRGFKITKTNDWVPMYVMLQAYGRTSITSMAKTFGITRGTLYKKVENPVIDELINELKADNNKQIEQKLYNYQEKATQTIYDLMDAGMQEATRLKAAELVLKHSGIIDDKKKLELSGNMNTSINIGVIEYEEELDDEEDDE